MVRSRSLLVAIGAAALLVIAHAVHALLPFGGEGVAHLFSRWVYAGALALAAAVCLARSVHRAEERAAWALIGAGIAAWTAASLAMSWSELSMPAHDDMGGDMGGGGGMEMMGMPLSSLIFCLTFYPPALAGLILLVRRRIPGVRRLLWLDAVLVATAVAAVLAALVTGGVLAGTGPEAAWNVVFALADLFLAGVVVGALALNGWRAGRAWALPALGFGAFVVYNSIYLHQATAGTYHMGTVLDSVFLASAVLLGVAACQRPPAPRSVRLDAVRVVAVPGVLTLIVIGLLVSDRHASVSGLAVGLATLAAALAVVRWVLTFAENLTLLAASRREARSDALTGLGNRRRLIDDLGACLADATSEHPAVLVLLDLDGFKVYNDTFGHLAGDALLSRLGRALQASVGAARAYRLGGDEFCVLAMLDGEGPESIAARAEAALSERGDGFMITASLGWVLLPRDAEDVREALRLADERMYGRKGLGRASAGQQSASVLLSAVAERVPGLGEHLRGVAELADRMAARLDLSEEDRGRVRAAAELHDVGKMAVPDAILAKPGPLTPEEWVFVRRHPVIGARIVEAAPALSGVGDLVRASHERPDGKGYPDGLAGEQIPLAARIIAVCDAYDAMISNRPYRTSLGHAAALEELRRCAGTQFDPQVVEVFCAVVEEIPTPIAQSA